MTDTTESTALVEAPATKSAMASMAMVSRGLGGGVVLLPTTFAEVIAVAQMMAQASHAIPKHLRGNPGACMAVVLRSSNWEMDPFAVATKTYMVNDILAYESQLVSAVVNMRAPVKGRPKIVYDGEGGELQATFFYEMLDGDVLEYRSPKVKDIKIKNSPLWVGDPQQQLFYFCARAWARRWVPEVLMGVYTPDEVIEQVEEGEVRATSFAALEARAAASEEIAEAVVDEDTKSTGEEPNKPPTQPAKAAANPAAKAPAASPASDAGTTTAAGPAGSPEGSTSEALAAIAEEGIPSFLKRLAGDPEAGRPTETASAPDAAARQDSSASVTDASTALPEGSSFPGDNGPVVIQPKDVIAEGYPVADEVYHLNGDAWDDNGIRDIYRNGEPVGTARRQDGALIYEDHRPERSEPPTIPQDFAVYAGIVAGAQDWPTITPALGALKKSQTWADAPEEMRRRIHAMSFERLRELIAGGYKFDFLDNLHAYRCYIDWETEEDGLVGNRRVIHTSKAWMDLPTDIKITFDKANAASVEWIRKKKVPASAEYS